MNKKVVLLFFVFITLLPFISEAKKGSTGVSNQRQSSKHNPFVLNTIEGEYGVKIADCNFKSFEIEDYDYSKLDDDKKLSYAITKYMGFLNKEDIDNSKGFNEAKAISCQNVLDRYQAYIYDSLQSIKDKNITKSQKYYFAYTLSYLSKNGLYEYDNVVKHIKKLDNITMDNVSSFMNDNNTSTVKESVYNLIKFINEYENKGKSVSLTDLANNIQSKKLKDTTLFAKGNFDVFNSHTNIYIEVLVEGSTDIYTVIIAPKDISNEILVKFINTFSNRKLNIASDADYTGDMNEYMSKWVGSENHLYILPFNKNTYVFEESNTLQGAYNIYLYTIDKIDDFGEEALFIKNMNGENGFNIDDLKPVDIIEITQEEGFKKAKRSKFVKKGKIDEAAYSQYIFGYMDSTHGQNTLIPSRFVKFDINNDKKKEFFGVFELQSSANGEIGTYHIMLNEKTLEVVNDELNLFLMEFMGKEHFLVKDTEYYKGIFPNYNIKCPIKYNDIGKGRIRNFYQKLYTENGYNKIMLIEDKAANLYIDIINIKGDADVVVNTFKVNSSKAEFVWKGSMENNKPSGLLNTDASFDMNKASTLSEKAIVNDVNLRMLDRLSNDKYNKSLVNIGPKTKKKLQNQRRQMNRTIKNCNGNNKCIRDILYNDVFKSVQQ